ncbi:hypothetical protein [uncultured Streptomyces sp.]|uniref:hypothetical protein n=1 Tax=uncultured Streptomyces sp. TaxID=174707 RepID=UPI0026214E9B|nr:hypothetical protein [uncultured Streptomyces sp.]
MHQEASAPASGAPVSPAPTAVPAPPGASGPPDHLTTTIEKGSFCLARCSCGWSGPARRSRDKARTDAEEHRTRR